MLKVARIEEERRGNRLMTWWSDHGGVPVLEADADAVLMLRASGPRDLVAMSAAGEDDAAETVLLDVVQRLHALPAPPESVRLVPLRRWFRDLIDRPQEDPLLRSAAGMARELLAVEGPVVALHGDVHHGNVLDLGYRWAAIDPKGLVGHPAFDLANVLCNPTEAVAAARVEPRLERFAPGLGIDRDELAAWVVAWCGLSLAWHRGEPSWHARAARAVAARLLPR
jgi:streptomycin 6-kinase